MRLSCSETDLRRLAQALSCTMRRGDVIALHGDLGAGKTTFSRYFITAILGHDEEIPSPTFSLVQRYDAARMPIFHFDLYRLSDASELDELGFDEALNDGLVLVEWPQHAGDRLPANRLELHLSEADDPAMRNVELVGHGDWTARLERFAARQTFLVKSGWGAATLSYMQGDASTRSYARAALGQQRRILMDAPAMSDGPVVRQGKSYSALVHLAEDVRPFVAIGAALRDDGIAAPQIFNSDLSQGFLLLEDLGDRVFSAALAQGQSQKELWRRAVNVLVAVRQITLNPATGLPLPDGSNYHLPRFDNSALQIEVELLLDWYWPMTHGGACPDQLRQEFLELWEPVLERLSQAPEHWVLRDYHSPNLLCLAGRDPPGDIGVIDFQDAVRGPAAYDLVSLLQDARLDVAADLERDLFAHYCAQVLDDEPDFDEPAFTFTYAALGVQRNSKLLGIFARLDRRDGKPQYLSHLPRIKDYLARNLQHAELAALKNWYDSYVHI